MYFEEGHLYHIYNQGNNKQTIFYNRENYLFFLKKIRSHLLPYCDILAYCLMPNHFHLMVHVNKLEILKMPEHTHGVTGSHPVSKTKNKKKQNINQSIGVLLRSYTRAINKQQGFSGSLFREDTKSECLTKISGINPSYFITNQGTLINNEMPIKQYPQVCFNYIHNNPVKSRLVKKPVDWEFSSAPDYYGLRKGTLINKQRTKQYLIQVL